MAVPGDNRNAFAGPHTCRVARRTRPPAGTGPSGRDPSASADPTRANSVPTVGPMTLFAGRRHRCRSLYMASPRAGVEAPGACSRLSTRARILYREGLDAEREL